MLNWFAKVLLVATSLSPLLGAVAVNKFSKNEAWIPWAAVAVLLVFLCGSLLVGASRLAQQQQVKVKELDRNDKEVMAFLVAYLLPFLSEDKLNFSGDWLTGTYILAILFLVVVHSGAFHFNPVMGLLGYHFYEIKNDQEIPQLLISRNELCKPNSDVNTVKLAHNIYLEVK